MPQIVAQTSVESREMATELGTRRHHSAQFVVPNFSHISALSKAHPVPPVTHIMCAVGQESGRSMAGV